VKKYIVIIMMVLILTLPGCANGENGDLSGNGTESGQPVSAGILDDEPPALTVTCGMETIKALSGNYSWENYMGGEIGSAVIACGAHPLQCRDITPVIVLGEERTASLTFGDAPQPDKLEIICYSTDDWDNMDARGKLKDIMASVPPEIRLDKGSIYVVNAEWTAADGYGGKVEYSFYIS